VVFPRKFPNTINIYNRIRCSRREQLSDNDDSHKYSEVDVMLNNSVLYNGMIHPFTRMVIKGVIWYQGRFSYKI